MIHRCFSFSAFLGAILAAQIGAPAYGQDASPIDIEMDRNPSIAFAKIELVFPRGAARLWVEALDRPDVETKVAAAQSIALARRKGLTGLDGAVTPLLRELNRPDQHPAVVLAAAQALIALDAKKAADDLFHALEHGNTDLREIIEPALVRWDYAPARGIWLKRVSDKSTHGRSEHFAIEALTAVKEARAIPALRARALARETPAPIRICAARAVAELRTSQLEQDAASLLADATPKGATDRLVAALLLRRHGGNEATKLLVKLGGDENPAAAAVALARLVEIDIKLLVPLLPTLLASPDAALRGFAVETLFRLPSDDHLRQLGDGLTDPNPDVRTRARRYLRELAAKSDLRDWVIREGVRALASSDWRAEEQGAVLLGQLHYTPASKRMLELLSVQRPEALIAAAWGLRQLAVASTLPEVLNFVGHQHDRLLAQSEHRGVPLEAIDLQLSQLVQFLGQARYRPANDRLLKMLPRIVQGQPGNPPQSPLGTETRAAVAWALGMIHEQQADPAIAGSLVARLNDIPVSPLGGEHDRVRTMAAISLGRIKSKDNLPSLRRFSSVKPSLEPVDLACRWAIAHITGEPLPPAGIFKQPLAPWFLSSIEE